PRGDLTARGSLLTSTSGGTPVPPFRRDCRTTAFPVGCWSGSSLCAVPAWLSGSAQRAGDFQCVMRECSSCPTLIFVLRFVARLDRFRVLQPIRQVGLVSVLLSRFTMI